MLKTLHLPTESLWGSHTTLSAGQVFNCNVDFESIKSQGAWSSDAVYKYLFANLDRMQQMPCMFQQLEQDL